MNKNENEIIKICFDFYMKDIEIDKRTNKRNRIEKIVNLMEKIGMKDQWIKIVFKSKSELDRILQKGTNPQSKIR